MDRLTSAAQHREVAWDAVHEALPAGWRAGLASRDVLTGKWSVAAVGPHPGRGKMPEAVSGNGDDEASALHDLAGRLTAVPAPHGSRMDELRGRLALAYR